MKFIKSIREAFADEEIAVSIGVILLITSFYILGQNLGERFGFSGSESFGLSNMPGVILGIIVLLLAIRLFSLGSKYKQFSKFYFKYKRVAEFGETLIDAMSESDLIELQKKYDDYTMLVRMIDDILALRRISKEAK